MKRRSWLTTAAATLLTGCFWPREFDLEWDEEVQLHDGRVIVVHLKRTYERRSSGITPYGGQIIPLACVISFDIGSGANKFTQSISTGNPMLIEHYRGIWYLILSVARSGSNRFPIQDWGQDQNGNGQYVVALQDSMLKPVSICVLPNTFNKPNILIRQGEVSDLAQFDGKHITLQQKAIWTTKFPLSIGDHVIERPPQRASFACKTEIQPPKGETK